MRHKIRLLSTDFDGTLVSHASNPVFDHECMELIRQLQRDGAFWAVNTGRSVELLECGLMDHSISVHPDFILTSERDVFRRSANGSSWEAFGDWNERCARDHAELFNSESSVLAEVIDFVNHEHIKARVIYQGDGTIGIFAESEMEVGRVARFIDQARGRQPKLHYQRSHACLRLCHSNYHKGAALAELSRLVEIPCEEIFAVGDHYNDISMLDGRYAKYPACPANALIEVRETVRHASGYVAQREFGAGVYEALLHFLN